LTGLLGDFTHRFFDIVIFEYLTRNMSQNNQLKTNNAIYSISCFITMMKKKHTTDKNAIVFMNV